MGKYSTREDIQDELIKNFTKDFDHIEAEEYVDKVLSKVGIETDKFKATSEVLTNLAVVYATYKRAFYESRTKGDVFYQKYKIHEIMLRDLTAELIKSALSDESAQPKQEPRMDYNIMKPDVYLAEDKVEEWVLENRLDEILDLMTAKYSEEILHFTRLLFADEITSNIFILELECLKEMAIEWYRDTLIEEYPDMIRG